MVLAGRSDELLYVFAYGGSNNTAAAGRVVFNPLTHLHHVLQWRVGF